MSSESIYAPLLTKVLEYKEDIKTHLAAGGAKTIEDYASMVGEYRCLNKIHEDILDIEKRYIND
tara:strand:+ start:1371 stop:1562 length:192 start_codon:yes stop_codon:yes gene_type:complete